MVIKKSTSEENLEVITENLVPLYGTDFTIKPEGVIDNIGVAVSGIKQDFEDQLLSLKKNLNPYTAGGEAQDGLYALRGKKRRQSTFTIVQRTIEGTPGTLISAGSLLFENSVTKDQFQLADDVVLDEEGKTVGSFKSLLIGKIDLPTQANINILTPLFGVSGVYYTTGNAINIGVDYEKDEEFRRSFLKIQNEKDSLKIELLKLVNNPGDLRIIQNRGRQVYSEIPLRTKKITIYSAESNQKIAQTIFDNMVDAGFDLDGDIVVVVYDDNNEPVEIRFNRAEPLEIYVKSLIVKKTDISDAQAIAETKAAILEFITSNSLVMGEKVVANRFNAAIDEKSSVEYPCQTLVSSDNVDCFPVLTIKVNQIPLFDISRIEVDIEKN